MTLNTLKCNHLTPLGLKGLNKINTDTSGMFLVFTTSMSDEMCYLRFASLHLTFRRFRNWYVLT